MIAQHKNDTLTIDFEGDFERWLNLAIRVDSDDARWCHYELWSKEQYDAFLDDIETYANNL